MILRYRRSTKKITAVSVMLLMFAGIVFYTLTGFAQIGTANSKGAALYENEEEVLKKAFELRQKNDFTGARKVIQDYISEIQGKIPEEIYLSLGFCWYSDSDPDKEKNLNEAINVFEEAYDAYPENLNLLKYYAASLYGIGNYEDAAPVLEKIYEKNNGKLPKYLELASSSYYQIKNYEEAVRVMEKLISLSEEPKITWYSMIFQIYYKDMNDKDKAKGILNEALKIFPGDDRLQNYKNLLQ